jgi:hypothetical protein
LLKPTEDPLGPIGAELAELTRQHRRMKARKVKNDWINERMLQRSVVVERRVGFGRGGSKLRKVYTPQKSRAEESSRLKF